MKPIVSISILFVWLGLQECLSAQTSRTPQDKIYRKIDQHAIKTPQWADSSINTFVFYLTKPAKTAREKARAIYRWVTHNIAYDTEAYFAGNLRDYSTNPVEVFRVRKSVCDGYAELFRMLGESAGLEVVKISGYAKGHDYSPGDKFSGSSDHAWNAVKIDSQWYFIDATWGAGYVDKNDRFVREFDDYYFLTPPGNLIYSHFPEDPEWQLLDSPITPAEFEQLPVVGPAFFRLGLEPISHPGNMIKTDDQVTITLRASDKALLLADLERENQNLDSRLIFIQKNAGRYEINALFPEPGQYQLNLFAKHKKAPEWTSADLALRYTIQADSVKPDRKVFPLVYRSFPERGCYLYSPMDGNLKSGTKQFFKLNVPGVKSVAVVVRGNWLYLKKTGDLFEGDVLIDQGKITVFARFPKSKMDLGLIEYTGF